MSMVTVTVMAMTTIGMNDRCFFNNSNGTIAVIICIVRLTANASVTTMSTAQAIIYHRLFYDNDKTIVAIIYVSFFS